MSYWRNYHVYYSDVDRLLLECVAPFLEQSGGQLETFFWERHYVGGPNLRVHIRGSANDFADVAGALVQAVETFLTVHPSANAPYSPAHAATLMQREGGIASDGELTYRNNVIEEHSSMPDHHRYASDAAADLVTRFRHDIIPVAMRVIGSARPKREELLRLFFLQPLLVCRGNLPAGCVSYRSHWEGFSITTDPDVVARIRATYSNNRNNVIQLMLGVVEQYEHGALGDDPLLGAWGGLLSYYADEARRILAEGTALTEQPATPEEVRRLRGKRPDSLQRHSTFVRVLGSDERFLASTQYEAAFLVPRVLTNLLYIFVASAGLNAVERMALCCFAYSAVEEHYGCDLCHILERNVSRIVERHASRWAAP